ncbi:MAG: hypothetical protein OXF44_00265 [Anaerolineaceae bacterium]|nr:hypothetical protein [Anaerolineaceae bacterium]MCY4023354.1 hypothetical protein [Anaerolineaceae bacterium]
MPWGHGQWGIIERTDTHSVYLVYRATGQDAFGLLHAGTYRVQPMPNRWHPFKQNVAAPAQAKPVSAKAKKHISLANRYAKPGVSYSDEEIRATLKEIRSQWEEDFDEQRDSNP